MTTEQPEIIPPEASAKRPSEFADEIFDEICDRMANGKGLREICTDPDMPSRQTFLRWIEKDTARQTRYQQAREALMDWYAEEILEIAWDDSGDTIKDKAGNPKPNNEWINRSRLKVDTLKFLMAKLYPKRYGERLPEMALLTPEPPTEMKIGWIERTIVKPAKEEPRQLTFQPDPLPGNLSQDDWTLLQEILNLIRRTIPSDDNSPPEAIFSIIRQALLMHFREVAPLATPEVEQ